MTYESELSIRLKQIEGLTLTSTYLGLEEKDGYFNYSWNVVINYNGQSHNTKYWCGSAYNKKPNWIVTQGKGYYNRTIGEYKSVKDAHNSGWVVPLPPAIDDVIHCWFVDASCAVGTFEDYCSEFGYDTDSRKQLEIYLECQKTRSIIIKMFGQKLFDELNELAH